MGISKLPARKIYWRSEVNGEVCKHRHKTADEAYTCADKRAKKDGGSPKVSVKNFEGRGGKYDKEIGGGWF